MNDIVPSNVLAKQGVVAVAGIGGGVVLMVLGALPGLFGIIGGALVLLLGLGGLSSREKEDRTIGGIAAISGALLVLSRIPLVGGLSRGLLGLGTLGLVGLGVWSAIKFFRGLKSRS